MPTVGCVVSEGQRGNEADSWCRYREKGCSLLKWEDLHGCLLEVGRGEVGCSFSGMSGLIVRRRHPSGNVKLTTGM